MLRGVVPAVGRRRCSWGFSAGSGRSPLGSSRPVGSVQCRREVRGAEVVCGAGGTSTGRMVPGSGWCGGSGSSRPGRWDRCAVRWRPPHRGARPATGKVTGMGPARVRLLLGSGSRSCCPAVSRSCGLAVVLSRPGRVQPRGSRLAVPVVRAPGKWARAGGGWVSVELGGRGGAPWRRRGAPGFRTGSASPRSRSPRRRPPARRRRRPRRWRPRSRTGCRPRPRPRRGRDRRSRGAGRGG